MGIELSPTSLSGWIRVEPATHYDAGNYTCAPPHATSDTVRLYVANGEHTRVICVQYLGYYLMKATRAGVTTDMMIVVTLHMTPPAATVTLHSWDSDELSPPSSSSSLLTHERMQHNTFYRILG